MSASDFIKIIDAYEEENSTDVLLGSIDCFTEDTYEMFNKKGYNGKERIDYLVGKYGAIVAPSFVAMKMLWKALQKITVKMEVLSGCSSHSGQRIQ